jgi:four helix bundle suffix protein
MGAYEVAKQRRLRRNNCGKHVTDSHGPQHHRKIVRVGQCQSISSPALAANASLSLINLACYLSDRQMQRLAKDFENEGGFY